MGLIKHEKLIYLKVRQYSALLLRKRYSKGKNWSSLKDHVKAEFKAVLIQVCKFILTVYFESRYNQEL